MIGALSYTPNLQKLPRPVSFDLVLRGSFRRVSAAPGLRAACVFAGIGWNAWMDVVGVPEGIAFRLSLRLKAYRHRSKPDFGVQEQQIRSFPAVSGALIWFIHLIHLAMARTIKALFKSPPFASLASVIVRSIEVSLV